MNRYKLTLKSSNYITIKELLLEKGSQFDHFCFLDSNQYPDNYGKYDWLSAIDSKAVFTSANNCFKELKNFRATANDWLFGYLNYNLKNQTEKLITKQPAVFGFEQIEFFVPKHVFYCKGENIFIESFTLSTEEEVQQYLQLTPIPEAFTKNKKAEVLLKPTLTKEAYLSKIKTLKKELQYGNIYEINFCQEFVATANMLNTVEIFSKLNTTAKAPFSVYYKSQNNYLLCASPERYLQKQEAKILVQPIKGTAKRYANLTKDNEAKNALLASEKERAENVMIVDLMRNDLSRTAKKASVKVEELFGLYSFNAVHQMISTISSQLDEKYTLEDVLQTTFPMGSMTGAPKRSAMQLIDTHENFNRELYSGSVGYIEPNGDADFNVVIRSFLYNSLSGYLSARFGGAITILSNAEAEYEECLLKAEKLFEVLR